MPRNNILQQQLCNVAHMNIESALHALTIESVQKYDANMPRPIFAVDDNIFTDYHNNIFLLLLLLNLQLKICCSA